MCIIGLRPVASIPLLVRISHLLCNFRKLILYLIGLWLCKHDDITHCHQEPNIYWPALIDLQSLFHNPFCVAIDTHWQECSNWLEKFTLAWGCSSHFGSIHGVSFCLLCQHFGLGDHEWTWTWCLVSYVLHGWCHYQRYYHPLGNQGDVDHCDTCN